MSLPSRADPESTNGSSKRRRPNEDDLTMRPPLLSPPPDGHDEKVKPMICRMFVASHTLRLDMETRFTAIVLWHRYVAAITSSNSLQKEAPKFASKPTATGTSAANQEEDDMEWAAAAACFFLTCKVEEDPRRLRDIINAAHMFLKQSNTAITETPLTATCTETRTENQTTTIKDSKQPSEVINSKVLVLPSSRDPPPLNVIYWETKEVIVRSEQIVLRWLGFDVSVSKPHRAVSILVEEPSILSKLIRQNSSSETQDLYSQDQIRTIAWRRLNDALFYSPALQHSIMELACAALALAVEEEMNTSCTNESSTTEKSEHGSSWWNMVDVDDDSLERTKLDLKLATQRLQQPTTGGAKAETTS